MPKKSATAAPIMENPDVKALISILTQHDSPGLLDLRAILSQVTAMEQQLEATVKELSAMRRDLAEMERQKHPLKNAMQKAVINMQAQILDLRDKLGELKQAVIDGCKNAVAAFKEKGITALDNLARFFKVRPILEAMHTGADKAARFADKTVTNIETASARYHEAGRNLKNAGRALTGKDAIQDAKPQGLVSKAFALPFRAVGAGCRNIRNRAVITVSKLKQLEEKAKPSVYKEMEKHNEQIQREERAAPKRTRGKSAPDIS